MNCAEFLDTIATAPVQTWALPAQTQLSEHRRTCERCDLLASELERAEQGLGLMLDNEALRRSGEQTPSLIAARARRRPYFNWVNRWGRRVAIPFTFAAGVAVGVVGANNGGWWGSPMTRERATETYSKALVCVNTTDAAMAVEPYLQSRGSYARQEPQIGVVTVRGTPREIAQVNDLLVALDNPNGRACRGGNTKTPTAPPTP